MRYVKFIPMKKICLVALILIPIFSCKKSSLEFSCDPVINEFVIENREELAKINTQELISYEPPLQRAIFNSWDRQKKRKVWIDKLQFVLRQIQLTTVERLHIEKLVYHIGLDYFKLENDQEKNEYRSKFAADWISYATKQLKWSKQFIAFVVYRLYTDQSQFSSELSHLEPVGSRTNTNSETSDCGCNASADFCGEIACGVGGCKISSGCGWLWSMTCDGNCY